MRELTEFDQLNTIRDFSNHLVPGAQAMTDTNAQATVSGSSEKTEDLLDVGVVNGKAISLPRPEYPSVARSARASGSVSVFVTIDETGKVVAARAIKGHPMLREVSEAAAKQARFTPTMVAGQPVKVTGIIFINSFYRRERLAINQTFRSETAGGASPTASLRASSQGNHVGSNGIHLSCGFFSRRHQLDLL